MGERMSVWARRIALLVVIPLCFGCGPRAQPGQVKSPVEASSAEVVRFGDFTAQPLPFAVQSWKGSPGATRVNAVMELNSFEMSIGAPTAYGQGPRGARSIVYIHVAPENAQTGLVGSKRAAGSYEGLVRYIWEDYANPPDQLVLPAPFDGDIQCSSGDLQNSSAVCTMHLREIGLLHSFNIRSEVIKQWRPVAEGYLAMVRPLFAPSEKETQ